jgi:hypothetical protein
MMYTFEADPIVFCGQCPCFNDDGGGCMLGYHNGGHNVEHDDFKPMDCPLVEVD